MFHSDDASPSVMSTDLPAGVYLLDVREDDEWAAGHAPEAVHIPVGAIAERAGEIPQDREVYVICRSGARSAYAAQALRARLEDGQRGRRHDRLGRRGPPHDQRDRRGALRRLTGAEWMMVDIWYTPVCPDVHHLAQRGVEERSGESRGRGQARGRTPERPRRAAAPRATVIVQPESIWSSTSRTGPSRPPLSASRSSSGTASARHSEASRCALLCRRGPGPSGVA